MDQIIKNIIEEAFKSKKQQRYFYAKAGDESLPPKEQKKWKKWAKEFSDKTNFKKLPEKAKKRKQVEEIVDDDGNIMTSKIPLSINKSGITVEPGHDKKKEAYGSMGFGGPYGVMGRAGGTSLKYWAEADMHKALGFDDTMDNLESYDEALKTMMKDYNLSREEAIERLKQMGYDKELEKNDEVILVENPKKFIEEFIDNLLLNKKSNDSEIVEKDEYDEKEINPIILKQIEALKQTLKSNKISTKQIIKYIKENK